MQADLLGILTSRSQLSPIIAKRSRESGDRTWARSMKSPDNRLPTVFLRVLIDEHASRTNPELGSVKGVFTTSGSYTVSRRSRRGSAAAGPWRP